MRSLSVLLAALFMTTLAACGLRGDLERPAPLFGDADKADAEARIGGDEAVFADEPTERNVIRFNEFGGVIPDAAPVEPVEEGPITGESE